MRWTLTALAHMADQLAQSAGSMAMAGAFLITAGVASITFAQDFRWPSEGMTNDGRRASPNPALRLTGPPLRFFRVHSLTSGPGGWAWR